MKSCETLFRIVIPTIVLTCIFAWIIPIFDGTHRRKAHENIEASINFVGDIHSRDSNEQWKLSTTHEVDLWQQWSNFYEHQDKHPCLWSTLSINGFAWSDDAIFAVWLSYPRYFNSYNETSLGAVNQLLKTQLHEAVTAEPGVQPSFCWRETSVKGHFEAIKHRQQKSDHECFVIVRQSTAESPMDVAPKIRIHRQRDTRNSNVVRYFGSTAETTLWRTLPIERPSPHSLVLCGMISFGILLATQFSRPCQQSPDTR